MPDHPQFEAFKDRGLQNPEARAAYEASQERHTLADFVLARIEEDDSVARYAASRGEPTNADFEGWWLGHYQHVQRHRPKRVVANCAANRELVNLFLDCGSADMHPDAWVTLQSAVKHLAAVYADHPDYREEWKP